MRVRLGLDAEFVGGVRADHASSCSDQSAYSSEPTTATSPVRSSSARCSACYDHALETYGQCVGCGVDRLTPGIAPDGDRWCSNCAGGLGEFHCERCGREARRYLLGVCGICVLAKRLEELLDDGAGRVRPELVPFFDEVRSVPRPKATLTWVGKPHVQKILCALARGEVPLTHEGLSTLSPWRSDAHVRDLLMHTSVLSHRDRHLLLFERRLPEWLDSIKNLEHRQLLNRFATWHILCKIRATAAKRPRGRQNRPHPAHPGSRLPHLARRSGPRRRRVHPGDYASGERPLLQGVLIPQW